MALVHRAPESCITASRSHPPPHIYCRVPNTFGSTCNCILITTPRAVSHLIIINLFECGVSTHCNIMLPELEINGSLLPITFSLPLSLSPSTVLFMFFVLFSVLFLPHFGRRLHLVLLSPSCSCVGCLFGSFYNPYNFM
ncbi:hypothetical protein BC629DRAFT_857058 [Irpex lacteus]|nr:hypothetical protein BC629DRAFT_857058 [Irpex lacteus]